MTDFHSTIPLLATIFVASIAGSGHCVGMCGPLMLLAVHRNSATNKKSFGPEALYHAGRLLGYAVLGLVAGSLGWMLESGGELAGLQKIAAYVSGIGMILFGSFSLLTIYRKGSMPHFGTAAVGKYLTKFIKKNQRLPQGIRPFGMGLITACLPCGWLYAFLLLAVAARNPLTGSLVMIAFWLGTIPALSLTGLASRLFPQKWNQLGNTLIATLLIVSGIFTMSIRAHADMGELQQKAEGTSKMELLKTINDQPLPCCQPKQTD
ncbi:sulfite exporter TauE/SafE family protein [uncultured Gimesia sp.]|uniref:sulfite exporter TauE/SafE family protein n=1 Tax=uncultured Gimesia sp. TaxID=1678688 RepID=UPI0030DC0D0C|tara:strand:- start:48813 stop:49604 length:792 start_codon:yes stop_codon:yes gene_type:complete